MLRLVEEALARPHLREEAASIQERLRAHAAEDVAALNGSLERRARTLAERAARDLDKRAETEAREMAVILEAQRERIRARQREIEEAERQLRLVFNADEERQLAADRRHWAARLSAIARELTDEPDRVRRSYVVKASRVEPVGLVYLWPLSS